MEEGQKGEEKCFGCKEKATERDREGTGGVMGRGELTLQNGTLMGARPCLSVVVFFKPVWFC